ncbi:MAG: class I SAM-dependent methyltransferase [Nanoarchaeota archaeon]|nr:class I SAM-dependent methyltransferase [Nanoarchaeota archaeon]MCG2719080.1 class I SAM-dependent methyltransferase [Nanoarchaeota archaeon]
MAYIDFVSKIHKKTKRNYLERMTNEKPEIIEIAKKYDYEYWDGDRKYGYGGFRYDGRWRPVAEDIAKHYNLKSGDSILDVGCGKAFLLYEFTQAVPGIKVSGIDMSKYAIEHAKEEVKPYLRVGLAQDLPYEDHSFDLVISINTIHNTYIWDVKKQIQEIERVGKKHKYLVTEAYRNEREKFNLMCWVLTGECFFHKDEWEWLYKEFGYTGDYSFIYFE